MFVYNILCLYPSYEKEFADFFNLFSFSVEESMEEEGSSVDDSKEGRDLLQACSMLKQYAGYVHFTFLHALFNSPLPPLIHTYFTYCESVYLCVCVYNLYFYLFLFYCCYLFYEWKYKITGYKIVHSSLSPLCSVFLSLFF